MKIIQNCTATKFYSQNYQITRKTTQCLYINLHEFYSFVTLYGSFVVLNNIYAVDYMLLDVILIIRWKILNTQPEKKTSFRNKEGKKRRKKKTGKNDGTTSQQIMISNASVVQLRIQKSLTEKLFFFFLFIFTKLRGMSWLGACE